MIVIHPSFIEEKGESTLISAIVSINGKEDRIWYKFPQKYQPYLGTENLDAFLVGLLFLGLKLNYNITLKAPVSAKLLYTLNNFLIPALVLANPKYQKINILPCGVNDKDLNIEKTAGTGMSCGIDSFVSYFDNLRESDSFRIKYFTFFNVGSHFDYGGDKARKIFQNRLESVIDFAKNEDKEVISVDSNLSEILNMNFQQTHSLRSISCVLHLQKLFKNYFYSSAYRFDHFMFNSKDTSDSDIFNVHMLSTESTNFFSSAAQYSRVARTLMIAKFPATFSKLDVCTNPPLNSNFTNCSSCYKCMRTQLTLDIANKLELYKNVFDLTIYYKEKEKYIGSLLAKKRKSPLDYEVLDFLRERKFSPSLSNYYYLVLSVIKSSKSEFKKFIKLKGI